MRLRKFLIFSSIIIINLLILGYLSLYVYNHIEYSSGDFEYTFFKYDNGHMRKTLNKNGEDIFISINGLSKTGKNRKTVIVPKTIDGIKVDYINFENNKWDSDILEKVFVPFKTNVNCKLFGNKFYGKVKVIMLSDELTHYYNNCSVYLSSYFLHHKYNYYVSFTTNYNANVSYMFNYDTKINEGYYWIDDYDYGSLIEYIPEDPVRDGYIFDGWYKEKECINKWDFDVDTLPEDSYHLYQETILYAKWVVNNQ